MNKRKLILSYSLDQIKKKDNFLKKYKIYEKELKKRNVILLIKKNETRKQLFNISLYGYDGGLKFVTNKLNSIPVIIKTIDNMPMGKIELKSIELYTNSHPETTIKGTGFKNENTAKKTIKLIKNKSKHYQFLVINTLFQRAKYHPHQTDNIKKAMKIFDKWLKNYKKNKKTKSTKKKIIKKKSITGSSKILPYLPLSLINKYEKLAEYYNVSRKARGLNKPSTSDDGFLVVYRKVKGNYNKMKSIPCKKDKPNGVNWDRKRYVEVSGKLGQAKKMNLEFFHKTGELKGLPTKIHINMIMWAYSPYPNKLKKNLKLLNNL
jgi:hypothetical protein